MNHPSNVFSAVDEYARLGLRTNIETATPHRIILLLVDGALEKLRIARLAMRQGSIAEKGANISWTISIIDGLRASLNLDEGGDIASNLDRLYDYMGRTLIASNLTNDVAKLNEVEQLLQQLRSGWIGIENEIDGAAGASAHNEIGHNAVGIS